MSAPVLGSNSTSDIEESFLLRSSEVENIPEIIEETSDIDRSSQRHSFSRSCSTGATPPPPPPPLLLLEQDSKNSDMSLPPPPPPPPVGDGIPLSMQTRTLLSVGDAGTLASIAGTSSNASTMQSDDGEEDTKKKKRLPAERSYYIAKELLMTERTYKKDLEVITWFRSNLTQRGLPLDYAVQLLFSYLDPIYEFHCAFLKQVEQRISMWEGKSSAQVNGDCQRIGDVILSNIEGLQLYQNYLDRQEEILTELEQTLKKNKELELTYKEFEAEKVCYLPLNTFLLKPGQRLLHYKLILDRLTKYYGKSHPDYGDCQEALTHVLDITHPFREKMRKVENLQKLIELQRDLVGIDSLVHPEREFIREGCLQKFSRKGYQQRMFFLFSDMLVYTSRTATSLLQFKVHGQLPLRGMMVEVSDMSKVAVANSFTIYGGNKCVLVAASTEEEKDKWIEDLNDGISLARRQNDDKIKYGSIKSTASSSENIAGDAMNDSAAVPPSPEKQIQHRANTTMHVCWHRNTSVSMRDHERAIKNQLSGYLLRKFKTSNGWQKLWVVFTNFCLFFYKTYQDDFPLASLPLLGYAVNVPGEDDKITKDHVFKLQFKNHVYFFRAESEYTFERWIEVINSATSSARRIRLFSRLESEPSGRS